MQARLKAIGAPIYGTKSVAWQRLKREEGRLKREEEIAKAPQAQREAEATERPQETAARAPPVPVGPTARERELHNLTHLPPAAWCVHCIGGRGTAPPHSKVDWQMRSLGPPMVQLDFGFMKSDLSDQMEAGGAWATTLVGVDENSGCILSETVVTKDKANVYMHSCVIEWLDNRLRHRKIRLQTDGEPAAVALARYVRLKRGEASVLHDAVQRTGPAHSSGSLGLAEAGIRRVQNQARALVLDVQERYKIRLHPEHGLWPWLIKLSGWLLDHFSVRANGRTPYMQLNDAAYRGEILKLAEVCLWRKPFPSSRSMRGGKRWQKADSAWKKGLWLGKEYLSDEHIIGTVAGVETTRTIRRLPVEEQTQLWMLESFKGAPWDRKEGVPPGYNLPRGPVGPEIPTPVPEPAPAAAAADTAPSAAAAAAPATPAAAPATPPATPWPLGGSGRRQK